MRIGRSDQPSAPVVVTDLLKAAALRKGLAAAALRSMRASMKAASVPLAAVWSSRRADEASVREGVGAIRLTPSDDVRVSSSVSRGTSVWPEPFTMDPAQCCAGALLS